MEHDGRLAGKVAVITGGASGFGLATAELFLRHGATVHVVDRDPTSSPPGTTGGPAVVPHVADVASSREMADLAAEVLAEEGRVDVVFANAGIEGVGTAAELDEDSWTRVIDVDLKGVWLTSKYFLDSMVDNGGGSIVNKASIGGLVGVPGIFPYAAAKGGVIALTRQMAVDYGRSGIRVNAVCPGTVRTPLVERNWREKGLDVDQQTSLQADRHPLRRAGTTDDIAAAVLFLASDDSSWITGQALTVDGGLTASWR
jgi:NAD(P)-dependent dehydrogenase (short-subunit alcohol dehydrogenase family)